MKMLIVGISVRTTNQHQQAAIDIPQLWNTFLNESIANQIPNKSDDSVYCIYTNYEKDYTKPYTCVIGVKVSSLEEVPDGLVSLSIEPEKYNVFTAASAETVYEEWQKIWNSPLERTYISDFEIYTSNKEVEIFVGVK